MDGRGSEGISSYGRTCFQDFGRSGNTLRSTIILMMVRFEQMQDTRSTDRGKRRGAERIG